MNIIMVRNAHHLGEEENILAGKEVGLSLCGKRQARLLAKKLAGLCPVAIYSSDFVRAIQTVEPLAKRLGLGIKRQPAFGAFNVGRCFGWDEKALVEKLGKEVWHEMTTKPSPSKRYFKRGETLQELADRAWRGLTSIIENKPRGNVIISTHMTVIGSLLCCVSGMALSKIWFWGGAISSPHPNVTVLSFDKGKCHLQCYSCSDNLANI